MKEDIDALTQLILDEEANFVVIDALADIMPGAEENSVKDVQPVFTSLKQVAETTQAAIVIIHHANKRGGYRGSSAIKAAVDLMIKVESAADSDTIKFSTEKARDIEPIAFAAEAHFGEIYSIYLQWI